MRLASLFTLLCLPALGHSAEPQWHSFDWASAKVLPGLPEERAALLLPAKVNGVDCRLQLDTGANNAVLWHDGGAADTAATVSVALELDGIRMTTMTTVANAARIKPGQCDNVITVGNAFFEQGTLTLDLGNQRYAYTAQALLAKEQAAQPLIYAQWQGAGGHTLVEIRLPSGVLGYALLDTGATRFGLSATNADQWRAMTDDLPLVASADVAEFKVNSWGTQVSCYETTVKRPLVIANMVSLPEYLASYCAVEGFKAGQRLVGLLGLRHLGQRTVTLDYLSRRWLLK